MYVTGCWQPIPSSQVATRSARPSTLSEGSGWARSSKPRQVLPFPGQHGRYYCRSKVVLREPDPSDDELRRLWAGFMAADASGGAA